MSVHDEAVQSIRNQIVNKFNPVDVILFGSRAKGLVRKRSDIDILLEIDCDVDLDVVVYTPAQWEKYKNDKSMFAHVIKRMGVSLSG